MSVSASSLNGLLSTLLSILLLKLPRSLSRGVKAFNGDCKELAAGCGAGLVTRPNEELSESARRCGARLVTRPNEELGDGARFAPGCGTGLVTLPNEVLSDGARCGLKSPWDRPFPDTTDEDKTCNEAPSSLLNERTDSVSFTRGRRINRIVEKTSTNSRRHMMIKNLFTGTE